MIYSAANVTFLDIPILPSEDTAQRCVLESVSGISDRARENANLATIDRVLVNTRRVGNGTRHFCGMSKSNGYVWLG